MQIYLYSFSKKSNSTLRPGNNGTLFECQVKTPSSIINPIIQLTKASNPKRFNYAYIPEWNRYYFIEDITYSIGLWILDLRVDVLASFRRDILDSTQYVLRSASNYDDTILDTYYPTKASSSYAVTRAGIVTDPDNQISFANYFNADYTDGYFVLGVISDNNAGVTYYQLTYTGFSSLLNKLMTYVPTDIDDVSDGIAKALFDPLQYITSCFWYPVTMARGIQPVTSSIKIGGYNIELSGLASVAVINQRTCHFRSSVTIPKHPQANNYSYLQLEPYSRYNLFFEPFGNIPLDTTKLFNINSLTLDWYIDAPSGDAELFIRAGDILVANVSALVGVQVRLSQLVNDILGAGLNASSSIFNTAMGIATGNYLGAIMSAGAGVMSVTNSMLPQLSTSGADGSFLSYSLGAPSLNAFYNILVNTNDEKYGRPLFNSVSLDSLSGYCKCSNANLTFSSNLPLENELNEILSLLNEGIFIEE